MKHICWVGGVHEYNPDGRCFVCEEIDKLAGDTLSGPADGQGAGAGQSVADSEEK